MSKSFIFLLKSFLGNFYRLLAILIWSHWPVISFSLQKCPMLLAHTWSLRSCIGPSPLALLIVTLWTTWRGFSPGWSFVTYVEGKTPTAPKHLPFHQSLSELSISVSLYPALQLKTQLKMTVILQHFESHKNQPPGKVCLIAFESLTWVPIHRSVWV